MKHSHEFFLSLNSRNKILRCDLAFVVLLSVWLASASAVRAQDELSVFSVAVASATEDVGMRRYDAALPSAPNPKIKSAASAIVQSQTQAPISAERGHAFYWLDRKSLMLGLMQGGAEIFDGATTRYFIHHCSLCFENDPMSRLLLGSHPSWGRMIPEGIAEALASTYSFRRLSLSPSRFLRGVAPLVPVGLTAVHVIEGARNISLKNRYRCADPGYVVVGAVCVMALPMAMGPSAVSGGSASRHD